MVLVNGVEGIGWDLPLCHSVFLSILMRSDAKKSSLRRSYLTLHGSKEDFFPGNMMKAMEFHPPAGKPRNPADLLKIAAFFCQGTGWSSSVPNFNPRDSAETLGGGFQSYKGI